ncbi:THAP domain-containing protein 5-like, partial [Sitodiplosis mosellana]|uniref:THAP domain-containing protein 5-like n=1 Tax=Sitodiplosis mosellana TaxID=263140 RepID=UPI002443E37D
MSTRKIKAYCQIISCENNRGTYDLNQLMFRAPSHDRELHEKWVLSIEKHQKFDNRSNSNVCIKHFQEIDLETRGSKTYLKKDAVPTIFTEIVESHIEPDCNSPQCIDCTSSQSKLCQIQKDLEALKISDDIQIQKQTIKIEYLQKLIKEKNAALAINAKELSKERAKNLDLEAKVLELKKKIVEKHFNGDEIEYNK